MEIDILLFLCLAAFVAGFVDAIVGGGGLIQTPVALILMPNVPVANIIGSLKIPAFSGTSFAQSNSVDSALPHRPGRSRSILDGISRGDSRRRGRPVTSGIPSDPDAYGTASDGGNGGCDCGSGRDPTWCQWGRGNCCQLRWAME